VITFELPADIGTEPAEATITFDECDALGAVNRRGTGIASRDVEVRELRARVGGVVQTAEINVTGLGGFLLAKCAAARARRKPKDWYDIAFVLLHNDAGGVDAAAAAIRECFGPELPSVRTNLDDLLANFADPSAQGPRGDAPRGIAAIECRTRRDHPPRPRARPSRR